MRKLALLSIAFALGTTLSLGCGEGASTEPDVEQRLAKRAEIGQQYEHVATWNLENPLAVAVDRHARVFVADRAKLKIFTPDGRLRSEWVGYPEGSFCDPLEDVAIDRHGTVYVADRWCNRIGVFSADGTFLDRWSLGESWAGKHEGPQALAVGKHGEVYYTRADAGFVNVRTSDGDFVRQFGHYGYEQFAIDKHGCVYVPHSVYEGDDHIDKYAPDGTLLLSWGTDGTGDGEFDHPAAATVDAHGYVYVADGRNHRIQKFTSDGEFVTKWGSFGDGPGEFDRPTDVAVGKHGKVYVADMGNDRIQVFAPVKH